MGNSLNRPETGATAAGDGDGDPPTTSKAPPPPLSEICVGEINGDGIAAAVASPNADDTNRADVADKICGNAAIPPKDVSKDGTKSSQARAGSKRKRAPTQEAPPRPMGLNAVDVMMESARRQQKTKKRRTGGSTAFDRMMESALIPGVFEGMPPLQVLLDRCVKLMSNGDRNDDGGEEDDVGDADDDASDVSDSSSVVSVTDVEDVFDATHSLWHSKDDAKKTFPIDDKDRSNFFETVVLDTKPHNIPVDEENIMPKPESTAHVTKISGHSAFVLRHQIIVGLTFHFSDKTDITYGEDLRGTKISELAVEEGEHFVALETWHLPLPRKLQRMVFETSNGRNLSLGDAKDTPAVAIYRRLDAEDGHMIRELDWLSNESTIVSLKTRPIVASGSKLGTMPSLAQLAHQREYKRLRDEALELQSKAKFDLNHNVEMTHSRVEKIGDRVEAEMLETAEAKALTKITILQKKLRNRFDRKARALTARAEEEMEDEVKNGMEREKEIKRRYIADGSEHLQEHHSVVKHLATLGVDRYASMKVPAVCSHLPCRETFDASKLPATKRCTHSCCATKEPNCGCQVRPCTVCHVPYCSRHIDSHHKSCLAEADRKCGWHKESKTLKRSGCHKLILGFESSKESCTTCRVQCCSDCHYACHGDHYSDRYMCKECTFVLGKESEPDDVLCLPCYQDRVRYG